MNEARMLPGQIVHARNKTKSSVDNFPLDVATLKIQRSFCKKKIFLFNQNQTYVDLLNTQTKQKNIKYFHE